MVAILPFRFVFSFLGSMLIGNIILHSNVKKLDALSFGSRTDTVDPQYAKHWTTYAEDYLRQLKKHKFDQDSKTLMAWVKKFQTHDKDFAFHEKMSRNDSRETYGRCTLYSTCIGENDVDIGQKGVGLRENEACIPDDRRRTHEDCVKEDPKSKLFELIMIGWGPYQYVPIHDHPDGGCMIKVAKGPGFKETLYRFLPKSFTGQTRQFFCCQQRNITITGEDECPALECGNSYGCQAKGFSVKNMFQIETFLATRGGDDEVRTLKGNEVMHELWNPFNETTYQLSHYLGDFTRITFWYPDDYEHDIKCMSRGDDPRLKSFNSISRTLKATLDIGKGCNTCSP